MPALPTMVARLLHPDRGRPVPRPAQVDLRSMLFVGTAAWVVAIFVFAVLGVVSDGSYREQLAVSVAGLALGGAGLVCEHARRAQYRAVADGSPADEDHAGTTDGDSAGPQMTSTDNPPGP